MVNSINYLQEVQKLSDSCQEAYLNSFEIVMVPRHHILIRKGEDCPYLYVLEKGAARAFFHDTTGREITTRLMLETALVTPPSSFILSRASPDFIELLENSVLRRIAYTDRQALYHQYPELEQLDRRLLESYLISQDALLRTIKFQPARSRYQTLLSQSPAILQRIPLLYIASFLGISPETLSRIRAKA